MKFLNKMVNTSHYCCSCMYNSLNYFEFTKTSQYIFLNLLFDLFGCALRIVEFSSFYYLLYYRDNYHIVLKSS